MFPRMLLRQGIRLYRKLFNLHSRLSLPENNFYVLISQDYLLISRPSTCIQQLQRSEIGYERYGLWNLSCALCEAYWQSLCLHAKSEYGHALCSVRVHTFRVMRPNYSRWRGYRRFFASFELAFPRLLWMGRGRTEPHLVDRASNRVYICSFQLVTIATWTASGSPYSPVGDLKIWKKRSTIVFLSWYFSSNTEPRCARA